jgi:membrane-bound lytic murein transglycosylase D
MKIQRHISTLAALLAALLLAGCATTDSTYSSLPTPPKHPANKAPMDRATVTIPGPFFPPSEHPLEQLPPEQYADILDRIRVGYRLPDVQHVAVDREIDQYRSKPDFLDRTFKRGARYLYYIVNEIEKRNMPLELALLPVVESAFNPVAYSRSRASGLWQFIPSSGKHYGLEQNWWIDERRDVIEATQAALTYLQYLNTYFGGDWYLAIAAYNGGEGTVSRAVRQNQERGLPTDFFSLDLRAETRDYVPKLLAISRIVRNPEVYGLQFAAIPNQPYFEVVDPGRQVHLVEAASAAGITREDMFALNPGYNRMTTPPQGPHRLLLPIPNAEIFRQAMLSQAVLGEGKVLVAATEPPPEVRHTVKRGDTLSGISRKYDVPMAAIRDANGLRGSTIHPGDSLLIPAVGGTALLAALAAPREDIARQLPENQKSKPYSSSSKKKPTVHKVKSGDTLWSVSRKYGVTIPALAEANGLSSKAGLVVGARLEIPGSGSSASRGASSEAGRMTYQVRRGDTLSEIADKFNVSVRELMTWNRLRQSSSLRTGQRLVLYIDPSRQTGG